MKGTIFLEIETDDYELAKEVLSKLIKIKKAEGGIKINDIKIVYLECEVFQIKVY